jgi:uracil phosphoribosyltransferase
MILAGKFCISELLFGSVVMSKARVLDHPLVDCHLTNLRKRQTPPSAFRHSVAELSKILAYFASADFPTAASAIETPIQGMQGTAILGRVGLIPIMRAGISMVEPVLGLIPEAEVWHLGLYRDEQTALPVHYYSKLPDSAPVDVALILDPMLATGGSATLACEQMRDWGVSKIKLLSIIAAPEGIQKVNSEFPDVEIHACVVDEKLNEDNFIVPGLGDAGDRIFNTLH